MASRRRHDPNYDDGSQDMMLPGMARIRAAATGTERQRAAPVAAYGKCPLHHVAGDVRAQRTGLQWQGEHLVWRVHFVMRGGSPVPCRASGVTICHADARPEGGVITLNLSTQQRAEDNGIRIAACRHDANYGKRPVQS